MDRSAHIADRADARLALRRQATARPVDTPLVWIAAACAIGGLVAAALLAVSLRPEWIAMTCPLGLSAWHWFRTRHHDTLACVWLLVASSALAAAWAGVAWRVFETNEISRFAPSDAEPVCFEAVARQDPIVYPPREPSPYVAIPPSHRSVLTIQVLRLRDGRSWRKATGDCELTVYGPLSGVQRGDRLLVFGQLQATTPAHNDGQRDLAFQDRTARQLAKVWTESADCVTLLDRSKRTPTQTNQKPLIRAMLLGDASQIDRSTIEAFRRTGTLHVLVVSGLHVGLVAALLPVLSMLGVLPRRASWLGALLLVVIYVVATGARPPAVRAGVVAGAACIAGLLGRQPLGANSLAGAAIAVFVAQPGAWLTIGTQLSFLATATLLGVATVAARRMSRPKPPLERLIESCRAPRERIFRRFASWAAWVMGASVAIQIVLGPLVASAFHLLTPAAAALSLAVSPLIAMTVSFGMLAMGLETLGMDMLSALPSSLAEFAAWLLATLIRNTAEVPGAGFWVAGPMVWWAWMWIAAWAGLLLCWAYGGPVRKLALRSALLLAAGWFAPEIGEVFQERDELRCTFLAVGHGSATLIQPPGGGAVLVDAGALGSPERATDIVSRLLWSRGVTQIDALVITHADIDHYNAIPGLLERFQVSSIWTTTRMFPRFDDPMDRSGPAELKRLLVEQRIPIREVRFGDRLRIGPASAVVLHPDELGLIASDNANSLVLGLEYAGRRVLLPGDLESPGAEVLLAQEPYDCDLLLAPHHGSLRSNPPGFAAWCTPEAVVISTGAPTQSAAEGYSQHGAAVWSTHTSGAITAKIGQQGVRLTSYLTDSPQHN